MKEKARVVIIGGGITGCSIAWHLAQAGCSDVLLIEKGELTSGTTFHSVGLVSQFRTSAALMELMHYSIGLYDRFRDEGDNHIGWHQVGSLRLASSPDRLKGLQRNVSRAKALGLDVDIISASEALRIAPHVSPKDLHGAVYIPEDGWLDPNGITLEFARRARAAGVQIETGTLVTGVGLCAKGRIARVDTSKGPVETEVVINAAGQWAPRIAAMVGSHVPMVPIMHQYLTTHAVPGHELPEATPVVRDPDNLIYTREEVRGYLIGGFELNPKAWSTRGVSWDFTQQLLPEDWELFAPLFEGALRRFPALERAQVNRLSNGPDAVTPDGHYCLGPVLGVPGLFVAAGMSLNGIAGAGGVGRLMAEWVLEGRPSVDLHEMDVRRFGRHFEDLTYTTERAREVYRYYYHLRYPTDENEWGRPLRQSPLLADLQSLGVVLGEKNGWERANYFNPGQPWRRAGADQREWGWRAPPYQGLVAAECQATRERAGLYDMTSFSKLEVTGPGALSFLQRMACNNLDKPPGSLTYTQFLNGAGGIEADLTVCRKRTEVFHIVTGTSFGANDLGWLQLNLPTDGSVALRDITQEEACIGLWGPRARQILTGLTPEDVSDPGFPYLTARELTIDHISVWAQRVSYAGELGWEFYVASAEAPKLWNTILEAGQPHGLQPAGYKALESLRLEKGYVYWSVDVTPADNPLEAGLGFCVKFEKGDFLGRDALLRIKKKGLTRRLRTLVIQESQLPVYGSEAVFHDGKMIGRVRSASYGHTLKKYLAYCYLPVELATPGTEVTVDVFGEPAPAIVSGPVHDPKGERLKA